MQVEGMPLSTEKGELDLATLLAALTSTEFHEQVSLLD